MKARGNILGNAVIAANGTTPVVTAPTFPGRQIWLTGYNLSTDQLIGSGVIDVGVANTAATLTVARAKNIVEAPAYVALPAALALPANDGIAVVVLGLAAGMEVYVDMFGFVA